MKLMPQNPYGMGFKIKPNSNSFYELTVWRFSYEKADDGLLVAATEGNSPEFYKAGAAVVTRSADGWAQITLKFTVPKQYCDKNISIYIWNSGQSDIYFDDFCLKQVNNL